MLDNLLSFKDKIVNHSTDQSVADTLPESISFNGTLYCPKCGDMRKMSVSSIHCYLAKHPIVIALRSQEFQIDENLLKRIESLLSPSLWLIRCNQCDVSFTAIIYEGPQGQALAVFSSENGGLTTPSTPEGVSFYLDQAGRAKSVGANSAAIAMFRSALEHILFEQGYTKGMLNAKLSRLEEDIINKTAPKWAMELDMEFLTYLKELGNGAIHPNDGDVLKQSALDNVLLAQVTEVFRILLFTIYEAPKKKEMLLSSFREKAAIFKKG